jgi:hypothetical protein
MAVYKIFPAKDATIYSDIPRLNTGLDAILELNRGYISSLNPTPASRVLIQFPQDQIEEVINNKVTGSYSASLQMYLADASNLSSEYTLEVFPVYQSWDMGIGKYGQIPIDEEGASWSRATNYSVWQSTGLPTGVVTASHPTVQGGGNWYTASKAEATFDVYDVKDVDLNVTSAVDKWYSGSIDNNGFILKFSGSTEFQGSSNQTLNYFSRDTSTIYPPSLNIKWDDSVFLPSSQNYICTNANINVSLQNKPTSFDEQSVHKVRVSVRDKYPLRAFSTGSLATQPKYLPSSSYWSLIDSKTKDVVIDFDHNATKISADSLGNYFNLYMNGVEPYRYYQILIKSVIGSETVIFKDDTEFKVE